MNHRRHSRQTRTLPLTEEEALALLEICFHSRADDDSVKERVLDKIGDLCREFIHSGSQTSNGAAGQQDRASMREALDAIALRREGRDPAAA